MRRPDVFGHATISQENPQARQLNDMFGRQNRADNAGALKSFRVSDMPAFKRGRWRKASRTINDRPANRQRDTVVHWFGVAGAIAACGVAGTSGALGRMVQLLLRHRI
jgi:hypothetical protein